MRGRITERHFRSRLYLSKSVFRTISMIHDNPLLSIVRNPYRPLKEAGMQSCQKVLEFGCDPGCFPIRAAERQGGIFHFEGR